MHLLFGVSPMRAGRFLFALVLSLFAACSIRSQSPSQMPQGTPPTEEMLRKLMAQLGGQQNNGLSNFSPEQLQALQKLMQKTLSDPNTLENLKQQMVKYPQLLEQLKKDNPELVNDFKEKFPDIKLDPKLPNQQPNTSGKPNPNDPAFPPSNIPKPPNPAENREYQEMAKLWEQSVGPLDETPAVRQALLDMFSGAGNGKPGEKPFWADWVKDPKASPNSGLAKWLQGLNGGIGNQKLKLPKWIGGDTAANIKAPSMKLPTGPTLPSFSFGEFSIGGVGGLGTFGIVVAVLVLAAILAFLLWKYAPQLGLSRSNSPKPLPGLGPWPIDPRTIADRAGLIRAFEYISVLLCGDGARVWNHATIAEALWDSVPAAAPFAEPLAKLYAVARYTPLSEELSPGAIAEARGYLCQLAGVPAP